jgi:hypothetical protein
VGPNRTLRRQKSLHAPPNRMACPPVEPTLWRRASPSRTPCRLPPAQRGSEQ